MFVESSLFSPVFVVVKNQEVELLLVFSPAVGGELELERNHDDDDVPSL